MAQPAGPFWRADGAVQQRRLWTPAAIYPQIAAWFDASAPASISYSGGGTIASWADLGPAGNALAQATTTSQPSLTNEAFPLTRLPGVAATATTQTVALASSLTYSATTGLCVFMAVLPSASATLRELVTGTSNGSPLLRLATTNTFQLVRRGVVTLVSGATVVASGTTCIVGFECYTNSATLSVNTADSSVSTDPAFTTAITTILGSYGVPTTFPVGESLIFNAHYADLPRRAIEGYLAWKWGGVASLPATHPYANQPPLIGR